MFQIQIKRMATIRYYIMKYVCKPICQDNQANAILIGGGSQIFSGMEIMLATLWLTNRKTTFAYKKACIFVIFCIFIRIFLQACNRNISPLKTC